MHLGIFQRKQICNMNFFKKIFGSKAQDSQPAETGLHLKADIIETILKSHEQFRLVGKNLRGLKLFVIPQTGSEGLAYHHLFSDNGFKIELQRQLENSYVQLSDDWSFIPEIVEAFPEDCTPLNQVVAIMLLDKGSVKHKEAILTVLAGKTWKKSYDLKPNNDVINIGRGKSPVTDSGRIQANQMAFIDPEEEKLDDKIKDINLHVSRFHCYIKYDLSQMKYCLYLAKDIFQSGHITKILRGSGNNEQKIDINNDRMAYPLEHDDQIQFNKKAVLEFKLKE